MNDTRNLPAAVLERLTEQNLDVGLVCRGRIFERTCSELELRADNPDAPVVTGYATVYDYPYEVAGGPPWGWTETIARGAADRAVAERDDVRFLINHDGVPLARTASKTLQLESDNRGLRVEATLDGTVPAVRSLVSAMERGDLDEMSFAFRVDEQTWNGDYTERMITSLRLYDVSVVTYPANPATVAQVRTQPVVDAPVPTGYPLSLALAEAERLRLAARR